MTAHAEPAPSAPSLLDRAWLVLSSERTTSLLVILLAALASVSVFVPQGREAVALAADEHATTLHALARFQLTHVMRSHWAQALGALFLGNFVAVLTRAVKEARSAVYAEAPGFAPHRAELAAALPERAGEILLDRFRGLFGAPVREAARGSRLLLTFQTSSGARLKGMLLHLGMALLVVGAALVSEPVPEDRAMVRARLEVKDSTTQKVGHFDVVSGEPLSFFAFRARYFISQFERQKDGMGPAIRMERSAEGQQGRDAFWVFLEAPLGFDEKHRKGEVAFDALEMGYVPRPGHGMSSANESLLLILGTGLLFAGLMGARRAAGLIFVEAEGDRVRLVGLPEEREDPSFAHAFDRWTERARQALAED